VTIGQPYRLQLAVTAGTGTPPFTWSVAQGQLPKGLSLDTNTGLISGTAQSAAASATITVSTFVQVADSSTPSETSNTSLNFDVVGGALGFVYVAGDFGISEYSIGSDGTLALLGSGPVRSPGAGFNKLVVDFLHRFVYGLGSGSNQISQYSIAADGTLSEMTPLTVSLGDPSVQATDIVLQGASVVYVSSNLGVHQLGVGPNGQLQTLGPPVGPAAGTGAGCIAINPSSSVVFTCRGSVIDSYKVNTNGTVAFLTTSSTDARGPLAFDTNDTLLIATKLVSSPQGVLPALATYAIQNGVVDPMAASTGPVEVDSIFDLSVSSGNAFVVAGALIVPTPPGGGTNDHLSIYDLTGGMVSTPTKRDTGRGPGRVLALASTVQNGPPTPLLVYVTNSRDNNVAQCLPSTAPLCPTLAISSQDKNPTGITGFLGSPGK
jgi:hypothetical protein